MRPSIISLRTIPAIVSTGLSGAQKRAPAQTLRLERVRTRPFRGQEKVTGQFWENRCSKGSSQSVEGKEKGQLLPFLCGSGLSVPRLLLIYPENQQDQNEENDERQLVVNIPSRSSHASHIMASSQFIYLMLCNRS